MLFNAYCCIYLHNRYRNACAINHICDVEFISSCREWDLEVANDKSLHYRRQCAKTVLSTNRTIVSLIEHTVIKQRLSLYCTTDRNAHIRAFYI